MIERLGFLADRFSGGALKRSYWEGNDEITAPALAANVGLGHVSVHPFRVWRRWLQKAGLHVEEKIRGPALFGGPFFDRHPWVSGALIALDPLLDRLPGRFILSVNQGILCRRQGSRNGDAQAG
jgi:hypothetical protein